MSLDGFSINIPWQTTRGVPLPRKLCLVWRNINHLTGYCHRSIINWGFILTCKRLARTSWQIPDHCDYCTIRHRTRDQPALSTFVHVAFWCERSPNKGTRCRIRVGVLKVCPHCMGEIPSKASIPWNSINASGYFVKGTFVCISIYFRYKVSQWHRMYGDRWKAQIGANTLINQLLSYLHTVKTCNKLQWFI